MHKPSALLGLLLMATSCHPGRAPADKLPEIRGRVLPGLKSELEKTGLRLGDPVYLRVFKEEKVLECWIRKGPRYARYKSWPICTYSGSLGPKQREGDRQAPEGSYQVTPSAMNPDSSYHLSFNLGFPNDFDRSQGRTGSFLMIHGKCASVGCYAMTDPVIEEIYLLMEAAFEKGQHSVQVDAYPFRLTVDNRRRHGNSPWMEFWENLEEGFALFEKDRIPPRVRVKNNRYVFESGTPDGDS